MPVYQVKPEPQGPAVLESGNRKRKQYPSVSIPVSPEIIAALEVGKPVTVELQGTVRGLESRQSTDNDPWANRNELHVELRVVEAYPGDDSEEDADEGETDDMKAAIDKGLGYSEKE